ncbi:MAG TPA: type II secretion system protein [Holophaga sp.]|nr:type II secretion system protein [Holophaga sp.]
MRATRGFTLLEMLITATVLLILAGAVIPMAKNGVRRQKELELRRDLREMRLAIDAYKLAVEQQKIASPPIENNGYPESLEILVEGAPAKGGKTSKTLFLRRIPVDPFTSKAEWGLRSVSDEPGSTSGSSGCVFDVYSLAPGKGLNGIPYREW